MRKVVLHAPPTLGDHIGKHILYARRERKLHQRQVAELIGVTANTVLNWERAISSPTHIEGPGVARFLGYLPLKAEALAQRMYAARFASGLSQRAAAKLSGVSEDTWSKGEAGGQLISGILVKIEALLSSLLGR